MGKYKGMKGDWLGIAFRTGSLRQLADDAIMGFTMGEYVHCEVVLGEGENGKAYGAFQGCGGFMSSENVHAPPEWAMFALPLKDPQLAKGIVLHMLSLHLPYNYADLWQCCITAMLPWEAELDCDRPESWHSRGVFCSQVALLLLRRLARAGAVECPSDTRHLIEAFHSRGCSPNALFGLLKRETTRIF